MATYRRKSAIIEAVQFDPHRHPWPEGVTSWQSEKYQPRDMSWGYVHAADGRRVHVMAGDWIGKGAAGEPFVCKPDVFEQCYEPVYEQGEEQ